MEIWSTNDLYLASYLKLHHEILELEWEGPTCNFLFHVTEDLEDDVSNYTLNQAICDPKALMDTHKTLKKQVLESPQRVRT